MRLEAQPDEGGSHRATDVVISPSSDMEAIRKLGIANGLDESVRDETGLAGAWEARTVDGRLVGGIALERSGGLDVVKLKEFTLTVRYKGACGGCPSSSTGTLFAINNLLQSYVDDRLLVEPIY